MLVRNADDYRLRLLITPLRLSGRKRPFCHRHTSQLMWNPAQALFNYMCTSWSHDKGPEKLIGCLSGQRALILNLKLHWHLQPRHFPVHDREGGGGGNCYKAHQLVWVRTLHLGEETNIFSTTFELLSQLRMVGRTTERQIWVWSPSK